MARRPSSARTERYPGQAKVSSDVEGGRAGPTVGAAARTSSSNSEGVRLVSAELAAWSRNVGYLTKRFWIPARECRCGYGHCRPQLYGIARQERYRRGSGHAIPALGRRQVRSGTLRLGSTSPIVAAPDPAAGTLAAQTGATTKRAHGPARPRQAAGGHRLSAIAEEATRAKIIPIDAPRTGTEPQVTASLWHARGTTVIS